MDEKALVQRAIDGDSAAFGTLVERYQQQVFNLALRMVGSRADAEDLAQEAFIRAWRALPSFHQSAQFSPWLFLRSQKRKKTISLTMLQDDEDKQWDLPDGAPLPEQRMIDREEREALGRAFLALDPDYRQVLTLRIVNGCSYQEIGEILKLPEGTVKSRISRARDQLRKKMNASGNLSGTNASNPEKGGRTDVQK